MCLCSYWAKSIFCGSCSNDFTRKEGDEIHNCDSRNGGFPRYITISRSLYRSRFG
ncbi:hypothetical protein ACS0TY_020237 [Phlomoides rotata]